MKYFAASAACGSEKGNAVPVMTGTAGVRSGGGRRSCGAGSVTTLAGDACDAVEVELQLPLALGRQRAQGVLQGHVLLELHRELFDGGDFRERELTLGPHVHGTDETPLLQVTEMVLGDAPGTGFECP